MPRCQVYNFQLRIDNLWNSVLFFLLFEFETVAENEKTLSPLSLPLFFIHLLLLLFSDFFLFVHSYCFNIDINIDRRHSTGIR